MAEESAFVMSVHNTFFHFSAEVQEEDTSQQRLQRSKTCPLCICPSREEHDKEDVVSQVTAESTGRHFDEPPKSAEDLDCAEDLVSTMRPSARARTEPGPVLLGYSGPNCRAAAQKDPFNEPFAAVHSGTTTAPSQAMSAMSTLMEQEASSGEGSGDEGRSGSCLHCGASGSSTRTCLNCGGSSTRLGGEDANHHDHDISLESGLGLRPVQGAQCPSVLTDSPTLAAATSPLDLQRALLSPSDSSGNMMLPHQAMYFPVWCFGNQCVVPPYTQVWQNQGVGQGQAGQGVGQTPAESAQVALQLVTGAAAPVLSASSRAAEAGARTGGAAASGSSNESGSGRTSPQQQRAQQRRVSRVDDDHKTTAMLRNLPKRITRTTLLELMDREGFEGSYDFVYLPIDFRRHDAQGYAFINFVSPDEARRFRDCFENFDRLPLPTGRVCSVVWSDPHQGLEANVNRYRNSPLMHNLVPDSYRPIVLSNGRRVPFPPPTRTIREPRQGTERMLT